MSKGGGERRMDGRETIRDREARWNPTFHPNPSRLPSVPLPPLLFRQTKSINFRQFATTLAVFRAPNRRHGEEDEAEVERLRHQKLECQSTLLLYTHMHALLFHF